MKKKMVIKLAACFTAVLLFFAIVLASVFLVLFRQHTIAINKIAMEEKAESIATTLAGFQTGNTNITRRGNGHGNGNGGYGAYLRFVEELSLEKVWIVDQELNLITHESGQHHTTYSELPDNAEKIVTRVFNGERTYGEEFSGLLDTPTLTVGAPIEVNNKVIGAVLLHSPVSGIDNAIQQSISTLAIGSFVALVLSALASTWLAYRFTRPLANMNMVANQLASGDYSVKTDVHQQDEIGQLANTIDTLATHLQLASKEREALNDMKDNFVANVSHELRTPVAVLRGSLEVLKDGTIHQPEEVEEYYQQMLLESCHLERLVNDLLDYSRLQDAHFKLDMQEVNLCDIVHDVTRATRRLAMQKSVCVEVQCPQEECYIVGDYGRIRQLLMIIVDNALKFSPTNKSIEFMLEKKQHYIFTIINHGPMIPKEELPCIFDRFYKSNASTNKTGTGLGLPIAKEIAQRHNATIEVCSDETKTQFIITFLA